MYGRSIAAKTVYGALRGRSIAKSISDNIAIQYIKSTIKLLSKTCIHTLRFENRNSQ